MALYLLTIFLFWLIKASVQYDANWDSLDSRPIPDWYDKAKVGIFLHWGVYAVPSFGNEWFWWYWQGDHSEEHIQWMADNYPPGFTYQDFARDLRAEFFDPNQWADLFQRSGAKYVVLTSKHHDGYALWPSKYSYSWNSNDVGPHRDLVGDLGEAVRAKGLRYGLYHSLLEWFHPVYLNDKSNNWQTREFVDSKVFPEMYELVNTYRPDVLWSDGEWEASADYWKSTEFIAWLYNDSPVRDTVVVNDRWGNNNIVCNHGDFRTCQDRFNPGVLQPHKWENAMSLDRGGYGYRRTTHVNELLSAKELIVTLVQTISCGGNILINVGPSDDGRIVPIFEERLQQVGEWLSINGEAIYESNPWSVQNDTSNSEVWYTSKLPVVYAIILNWPQDDVLSLGSVVPLFGNGGTRVTLLGNEDLRIEWNRNGDDISITLPRLSSVASEWAWVLKISPP